jgi:23S rRNA (cytidine1920-2'-O)/16S rRNA (cytidine1409-2'-O)-methyltransferase
MEQTNAREVDELPFPPQLVVCDVSFISVRKALPPLLELAARGWQAVVLVKPQFEAGRDRVGKGGVVRDPGVHRDVLGAVVRDLAAAGLGVAAVIPSPVRGADGNVEFLALARPGPPTVDDAGLDAVVASVPGADGSE